MRQLVLDFGSEQEEEIAIPFHPEIQEHLVMLMAQAILAVVEAVEEQGGRSDDAVAIE